jgi:hypothetical protein
MIAITLLVTADKNNFNFMTLPSTRSDDACAHSKEKSAEALSIVCLPRWSALRLRFLRHQTPDAKRTKSAFAGAITTHEPKAAAVNVRRNFIVASTDHAVPLGWADFCFCFFCSGQFLSS